MLGSLGVTHPFHPLCGCELEILYVKRRSGALVFVCASGAGRSVTLSQAWTDRGVAARRGLYGLRLWPVVGGDAE
ncbi:DUF5372 family protein [Streptomyces sp. NPDC008222]|uniref:DUF5372 family protein n=1 Tax=Streptomyces sp. NPDC008222 TaxID=3364820 RepID=UPI0036E82AEC